MNIQRIAAFTYESRGGNPAGVVIAEQMPDDGTMLKIAQKVGYSETAFLKREKEGWRIRFFAPEMEVPFCGHATIASGAALGKQFGLGAYKLYLNEGDISIDVSQSDNGVLTTTLQSPRTWSKIASQVLIAKLFTIFNFSADDVANNFPIRIAAAGATHLIVVLNSRQVLADMSYDYKQLKMLMSECSLVTINLLWRESMQLFHSRNPFPPGGVYEDPATGAAAAAFAGYLRDIDYDCNNHLTILQGHDMGLPSRLLVEFTNSVGEGVYVTGETRFIDY